jgi:hypothetical protein
VQNTNKVMYCLYSIILTFKVEILTISYLWDCRQVEFVKWLVGLISFPWT